MSVCMSIRPPLGVPCGRLASTVEGVPRKGVNMDEHQILSQITTLVDQEHQLRSKVQDGSLTSDEEHAQLAALEGALDQCWDLLRQRRAKREFGQNVDDAAARPVEQVEKYLA